MIELSLADLPERVDCRLYLVTNIWETRTGRLNEITLHDIYPAVETEPFRYLEACGAKWLIIDMPRPSAV